MEITVQTTVDASLEAVWTCWTKPERIVQWNFASEEWQCPTAKIDLSVGGSFNYRMEAKDGSMGFDFEGTFVAINPHSEIQLTLSDDRKVTIKFLRSAGGVDVIETFEAENEFSGEQQRQGWQAILNNFKAHVEAAGT